MKITVALVLYKKTASESGAFTSLEESLNQCPAIADRFSLILFDNSPITQEKPSASIPLTFFGFPNNPGLAQPYNVALSLAQDWLLLLDQDTQITASYLRELCVAIESVPDSVVAVVPKLMVGGKVHSPELRPTLELNFVPREMFGIAAQQVTAYNSGACLRVSALQRSGGFPLEFTLDFLDHAVFRQLQDSGGKIYVLKSELKHDLSLSDLEADISRERLLNILSAQRLYYRKYGTSKDRFLLRLRLLKESAYRFKTAKHKTYAWLCLRFAVSG